MPSQTEENYLKALYHHSGDEERMVSTTRLAGELGINAASVTGMLKKLTEKGWVEYRKSYGARLTSAGREAAVTVIRRHRLWELFLVRVLEFSWSEVHELAEQLEHIQSERLTAAIDRYLGYPAFDPHGDPIPDARGRMARTPGLALSSLPVGQRGRLARVLLQTPEFMHFCNAHGLEPGTEVEVREREEFDGSMRVVIGGREQLISEKAGRFLMIE